MSSRKGTRFSCLYVYGVFVWEPQLENKTNLSNRKETADLYPTDTSPPPPPCPPSCRRRKLKYGMPSKRSVGPINRPLLPQPDHALPRTSISAVAVDWQIFRCRQPRRSICWNACDEIKWTISIGTIIGTGGGKVGTPYCVVAHARRSFILLVSFLCLVVCTTLPYGVPFVSLRPLVEFTLLHRISKCMT